MAYGSNAITNLSHFPVSLLKIFVYAGDITVQIIERKGFISTVILFYFIPNCILRSAFLVLLQTYSAKFRCINGFIYILFLAFCADLASPVKWSETIKSFFVLYNCFLPY